MEVGFGVSMAIYVCLFIVATGPGLRRFRASPGSGRFHARCIDVPRIYEAPGNACIIYALSLCCHKHIIDAVPQSTPLPSALCKYYWIGAHARPYTYLIQLSSHSLLTTYQSHLAGRWPRGEDGAGSPCAAAAADDVKTSVDCVHQVVAVIRAWWW